MAPDAVAASTAPLWLYPRAPQFPPLGPAADLPDLRRSLLEEKALSPHRWTSRKYDVASRRPSRRERAAEEERARHLGTFPRRI